MFDYDWFAGPAFAQQMEDAKLRCAWKKFPDVPREQALDDPNFRSFLEQLEARTLIYLRDGFSYEMKEISDVDSKSHLTFECEPVDDQYKVGAFVVSVPFEDLVRVEVFAVHPSEKPADMPMITGFRAGSEPVPLREDVRKPRDVRSEPPSDHLP
jgi:hypothetical protein